jgi:Bacterial regulatory protein, Fis family
MVDTRTRANVAYAQMRQWRDCKTTQERQTAVANAMQATRGVISDAAKCLGLSRQHLHRVLSSMKSGGDTVTRGDTVASRGVNGDGDAVTCHGGVTTTLGQSLTYGARVPSLGHVSSAVTTDEPTVRVAFDIPKRCLDWLDRLALKRKHEQGGRMAKSPIVQELIEREMQRLGKADPE